MISQIKIQGLDHLEKQLLKLNAKLGAKALRGALSNALKPMQRSAKVNVPIQTGALKRSIRRSTRIQRKAGKPAAIAKLVAGNKQVFYAHMVEFGTKNRAPNPFMRKALRQHQSLTLQQFKQDLKRQIDNLRR